MKSSIKDELIRKQLENRDLRNRRATTEIKTDDTAMAALAAMQEQLAKDYEKHNRETQKVEEFKKSYIKIRTDNIVLDHQSAIELVKMIQQEADTITYDDIC